MERRVIYGAIPLVWARTGAFAGGMVAFTTGHTTDKAEVVEDALEKATEHNRQHLREQWIDLGVSAVEAHELLYETSLEDVLTKLVVGFGRAAVTEALLKLR